MFRAWNKLKLWLIYKKQLAFTKEIIILYQNKFSHSQKWSSEFKMGITNSTYLIINLILISVVLDTLSHQMYPYDHDFKLMNWQRINLCSLYPLTCTAVWEQSTHIDWIKNLVQNSKNASEYNRQLKKTGKYKNQSFLTIKTKMKTLICQYINI